MQRDFRASRNVYKIQSDLTNGEQTELHALQFAVWLAGIKLQQCVAYN